MNDGHRLVITGLYKYIRHPMYSLGILIFISLMPVSENIFGESPV
ncbi:MAG: hypothetical protein JW864_14390 [Spirochaetes bacterium]|nr:hypothetical protein [Spirochaetota bacterium]